MTLEQELQNVSAEKLIVENHPYDTPEFIVLPIAAGNGCYLDWVSRSVRE